MQTCKITMAMNTGINWTMTENSPTLMEHMENLLSVNDLAKRLHCGRSVIYEMAVRHQLPEPVNPVAGRRRWREEDIAAWERNHFHRADQAENRLADIAATLDTKATTQSVRPGLRRLALLGAELLRLNVPLRYRIALGRVLADVQFCRQQIESNQLQEAHA